MLQDPLKTGVGVHSYVVPLNEQPEAFSQGYSKKLHSSQFELSVQLGYTQTKV